MHKSFIDDLKSRPYTFYIALGASGIVAYTIYKSGPSPTKIALSTITSSLIQHYAFNYLHAEEEPISDPLVPDQTEPSAPSKLDSYFA